MTKLAKVLIWKPWGFNFSLSNKDSNTHRRTISSRYNVKSIGMLPIKIARQLPLVLRVRMLLDILQRPLLRDLTSIHRHSKKLLRIPLQIFKTSRLEKVEHLGLITFRFLMKVAVRLLLIIMLLRMMDSRPTAGLRMEVPWRMSPLQKVNLSS